MSAFFEIFQYNPGALFVAGLVLGYVLRGINITSYRGKRQGRYQSVKNENTKQRVSVKSGLKEPSFEWANTAVKTLTPRQANMSLNPPRGEA